MIKVIKKFLVFLRNKVFATTIAVDPFDFSHAVTLLIIIKKDGTKEYRPCGYSIKKCTPITTIIYEKDTSRDNL